jgi:Holliday junction resolvase RusA-like endonuclease
MYIPNDHAIHAFKASVRLAFREAYDGPPHDGPVAIRAEFVFPRPSHMIWKTKAMNRSYKATRPDIDNICKGVLDALNRLAFVDDGQVFFMTATKLLAAGNEQPHTYIEIEMNKEWA